MVGSVQGRHLPDDDVVVHDRPEHLPLHEEPRGGELHAQVHLVVPGRGDLREADPPGHPGPGRRPRSGQGEEALLGIGDARGAADAQVEPHRLGDLPVDLDVAGEQVAVRRLLHPGPVEQGPLREHEVGLGGGDPVQPRRRRRPVEARARRDLPGLVEAVRVLGVQAHVDDVHVRDGSLGSVGAGGPHDAGGGRVPEAGVEVDAEGQRIRLPDGTLELSAHHPRRGHRFHAVGARQRSRAGRRVPGRAAAADVVHEVAHAVPVEAGEDAGEGAHAAHLVARVHALGIVVDRVHEEVRVDDAVGSLVGVGDLEPIVPEQGGPGLRPGRVDRVGRARLALLPVPVLGGERIDGGDRGAVPGQVGLGELVGVARLEVAPVEAVAQHGRAREPVEGAVLEVGLRVRAGVDLARVDVDVAAQASRDGDVVGPLLHLDPVDLGVVEVELRRVHAVRAGAVQEGPVDGDRQVVLLEGPDDHVVGDGALAHLVDEPLVGERLAEVGRGRLADLPRLDRVDARVLLALHLDLLEDLGLARRLLGPGHRAGEQQGQREHGSLGRHSGILHGARSGWPYPLGLRHHAAG